MNNQLSEISQCLAAVRVRRPAGRGKTGDALCTQLNLLKPLPTGTSHWHSAVGTSVIAAGAPSASESIGGSVRRLAGPSSSRHGRHLSDLTARDPPAGLTGMPDSRPVPCQLKQLGRVATAVLPCRQWPWGLDLRTLAWSLSVAVCQCEAIIRLITSITSINLNVTVTEQH